MPDYTCGYPGNLLQNSGWFDLFDTKSMKMNLCNNSPLYSKSWVQKYKIGIKWFTRLKIFEIFILKSIFLIWRRESISRQMVLW